MVNKKSYIGLIIIIAIFSLIFIPKISVRLKKGQVVSNNRTVNLSEKPLSFIQINQEKRKVPEFIFLNQDSLYVSNSDFIGKVFLIEFFFTKCPTICPIMNNNLKKLHNYFSNEDDFKIVSITVDPQNDTPYVLKRYSENFVENSNKWSFLTGEQDKIYNLANNGFNLLAQINPNVAGGFEHQGYFALIDKKGFIRSRDDKFGNPIIYYSGVDNVNASIQGTEMLQEDIKLLLKED
tara:strand:- start:57172 stop:57879 length:708 start_codon:yes stop_codon:yes gene_type:complete